MVICASSASARAQVEDPCLLGRQPWVAVAFRGPAFTPQLERAVLLDLRAGLRLKGIEVCLSGQAGSKPPLAVLELSVLQPDRLSVSIEVRDALTAKRVQRDVDLTGVAEDARSLTIAAATDELLRASWIELALSDAPPPKSEPPPEVQAALRDSLEPARVGQRDLALGARIGSAHFSAGLSWWGADLLATAWLLDPLGLELALGARAGVPRDGVHGQLETSALIGGLALRVALSERNAPLGIDALAGVDVASVRMRGQARPGGAAYSGSALDVHTAFSFLFRAAATPFLDLRLQLGVGAPLQGVEATDAGAVMASTHGIELRGSLGAELRL